MSNNQKAWDKIWKDKNGKVVIWQNPNAALWGWFIFMILTKVVHAKNWHGGLQSLSTAFLFTWAYMELFKGVNYFRRGLGLVVLLMIIAGYFASVKL